MERLLYVISRRNTFTAVDRQALEERYEVVEYYQPGFRPRPIELVRKLRRCDVVFGWFAAWHTLAALTLAKLLGKPSVLVIGGFDTASVPEIGYGSQQGGLRRLRTRWTVARATRLITNSDYSMGEIERNLGLGRDRVAVVHHGLPDRFGDVDDGKRPERMALSVGAVYKLNLERKGHLPFVRAAAELPDVDFVLAGRWFSDGTIETLRAEAGPNVSFTDYLSDAELDAYFRRAAVYVQASRHEGFGISLAEAMLARCVPVATEAGALPEVVGDTAVRISEPTPERVAEGVREALELGPAAGLRARERIKQRFPYEMRRDGICAEVAEALQGD